MLSHHTSRYTEDQAGELAEKAHGIFTDFLKKDLQELEAKHNAAKHTKAE